MKPSTMIPLLCAFGCILLVSCHKRSDANAASSPSNIQDSKIDFSPVEIPIVLPKTFILEQWAVREQIAKKQQDEYDKGLLHIPDAWAYQRSLDIMDDYVNQLKDVERIGVLAKASFPSNIVSSDSGRVTEKYELRRVSIPYNLIPDKTSVSKLADNLKSFRVDLTITDEAGKSVINISDILPSTLFVPGNYQITIQEGTHFAALASVNASAGGVSGPVIADGRVSIGGGRKWQKSFTYNWKPKNLQVASGASGNMAFVDFEPFNSGEFYVGEIPIELSLLVPKGTKRARLIIGNTIRLKCANDLPPTNAVVTISFDD